MAFLLASPTKLARDLWPDHVGSLKTERELCVDNLPSAKVVPDDPEELTEWLSVDVQPEISQAFVYIRSDVPGVDELGGEGDSLELVMRLQGVISEMNLTVGGDWDGTELNAKKAVQTLTLVHGGCPAAFAPQVRTLGVVRRTVLALLGRCDEGRGGRGGAIVLKKRVFTKVRPGVNDELPCLVKDGEDPRGKFRAVRHSWRVTERVVAGTHLAHGGVFAIPPLSLRKGDFVDVSVRVNVVLLRGVNGRRYDVTFEPTAIVRLASPQQFMRALNPKVVAAVATPGKQIGRKAMPAGYTFEGQEEGPHAGEGGATAAGGQAGGENEAMQQ